VTIVRAARPTSGFQILRNDIARDRRLSFRALGILVEILSRPDDWRTSVKLLAEGRPEGREAVRVALVELQRCGYVEHRKVRDAGGKLRTVTYVYDVPRLDANTEDGESSQVTPEPRKPEPGAPDVGQPGAGIPGPIRRTDTKNCYEDSERRTETHPPPSSSSAVAAQTHDEDDDASTRSQLPRQRTKQSWRERDEAEADSLLADEDIDQAERRTVIAYLRNRPADDGGPIKSLGRYIRAVLDDGEDKISGLCDRAYLWEEDRREEAAAAAKVAAWQQKRGQDVADWLARTHPDMEGADRVVAAFIAGMSAGISDEDLVAAVNDVHTGRSGDSCEAYLDALGATSAYQEAA
jgi:hypothetical protein